MILFNLSKQSLELNNCRITKLYYITKYIEKNPKVSC